MVRLGVNYDTTPLHSTYSVNVALRGMESWLMKISPQQNPISTNTNKITPYLVQLNILLSQSCVIRVHGVGHTALAGFQK